jgi:hypothetical protein
MIALPSSRIRELGARLWQGKPTTRHNQAGAGNRNVFLPGRKCFFPAAKYTVLHPLLVRN